MTDHTAPPDAMALATALAACGLPCEVEARDRLAILLPDAGWAEVPDAPRRRELHALAARFGFTHVALELDAGEPTEPGDAGGQVAGGGA